MSKLWAALFRSMQSKMPPSPQLPTQIVPNGLHYYDARLGKRRWVPGLSPSLPSTFEASSPTFRLLSWNIDFAAPLAIRRLQTALSHLETLISPHLITPPPPPTIILLQEIHTSCFQTLLGNAFIREFYQLTDIYSRQSYSTLTLVPKSLSALVTSVSRVPFPETQMQRDCVYVDLDIPLPSATESEPNVLRLRIANTHLESLNGFGDKARPKQLEIISKLLTAPGINGGLVAGDMNAIAPSDQELPQQVGLLDAWVASTVRPTGSESATNDVDEMDTGEAEGHTWGYQPKCQYPPRRLDKILTVGKLEAVDIQRVGVGLKLKDKDTWVSDHYGLLAKIVLRS